MRRFDFSIMLSNSMRVSLRTWNRGWAVLVLETLDFRGVVRE